MALETLGIVKILSALKCAALGLTNAAPLLVANSAQATQQLVTLATPLLVQGATGGVGVVTNGAQAAQGVVVAATPALTQAGILAMSGLATLGHFAAQGITTIKAGAASLGLWGTKMGASAAATGGASSAAAPVVGATALKGATVAKGATAAVMPAATGGASSAAAPAVGATTVKGATAAVMPAVAAPAAMATGMQAVVANMPILSIS